MLAVFCDERRARTIVDSLAEPLDIAVITIPDRRSCRDRSRPSRLSAAWPHSSSPVPVEDRYPFHSRAARRCRPVCRGGRACRAATLHTAVYSPWTWACTRERRTLFLSRHFVRPLFSTDAFESAYGFAAACSSSAGAGRAWAARPADLRAVRVTTSARSPGDRRPAGVKEPSQAHHQRPPHSRSSPPPRSGLAKGRAISVVSTGCVLPAPESGHVWRRRLARQGACRSARWIRRWRRLQGEQRMTPDKTYRCCACMWGGSRALNEPLPPSSQGCPPWAAFRSGRAAMRIVTALASARLRSDLLRGRLDGRRIARAG